VLGAVLVAVLWHQDALTVPTEVLAVAVVLGTRLLALRFRLQAPGPWDPAAVRAGRSGRGRVLRRRPADEPAPLLRWVARLRRRRQA
jgi:hypothetical protein